MDISGVGSSASLGRSLFQAMKQAADGAPAAGRTAFASLRVNGDDPLAPDIGLYGPPETGGFQDRTVTTTVDEIALKVDVARVAKPGSDAAGASGESTTETLRIRIETTVDPVSGRQTQKVVTPDQASTGALAPKDLARIAAELADGKGALRGVVSIDDHRTVTHTRYQTLLARDAHGKLTQTHQISTDEAAFDFTDTARSSVGFDATNANVETSAQIARRLADEYSSPAALAAHIPGLSAAGA